MRSVFVALFAVISTGLFAQELTYTYSFTEALKSNGLEYYKPVEQFLHVAGPRDDGFMQYDLILENDIHDFEVRYRIRPLDTSGVVVPQQVEITRLLASISVNDTLSDIRVRIPDPSVAKERFNAQSVLYADFKPKPTFSMKPHGALVSIMGPASIVEVVLLSYDPEMDPLDSFHNLRFIE